MRTKFLFSTLAMAAAFSACTQEEIAVNNDTMGSFDEVVGARLISSGFSVKLDEGADSRIVKDESGRPDWSGGDKAGLAWSVNRDNYVADEQDRAGLSRLSDKLYANHMLVYNQEKTDFESRGNIYQGWHFAYSPFNYMMKPGQLTVDVNGEEFTNSDIDIDWYENGAMFSNALFVHDGEDGNVDKETGSIMAPMPLAFVVNSLRPRLLVSEEFTEHKDLQNIIINGVTLAATGHDLFTTSFAVQPSGLKDIEAKDLNGTLVNKFVNETYFGNTEGKAFKPTLNDSVTTIVANAEAYNLGKSENKIRMFLAPTQDASSVKLDDLSFRIDVPGGHFDVVYKDGEELTETQEINNDAIKKLLYLLKGTQDDELNKNARDLKVLFQDGKQLPAQTLAMKLAVENFTADYLISDSTDWNAACILADALGANKPTFTLTKGATVIFKNQIKTPATGVNVICQDTKAKSSSLVIAGNLTWNENITTGAGVAIINNAELTVENQIAPQRLINNGTIIASGVATVGNKNHLERFENYGRVEIKYGAYVYPHSNHVGTIAYDVEEGASAATIKTLIGGGAKGAANVNTLMINEGVTLNLDPIANDDIEGDRYHNDASVDPTVYPDLSNINIELNNGKIMSTQIVNALNVTIEGEANTVANINVLGNLTIIEGENTITNKRILGTLTIQGGDNTINTEKIISDVTVKAGENAINGADIAGNLTIDGGSIVLTDVNVAGQLVNKGTVTIETEANEFATIGDITNSGNLTANTDVYVKTITTIKGCTTTVNEDNDNVIWYSTPKAEGGYVQAGTTTGKIEYINNTTDFIEELAALEAGETITLKGNVVLNAPLTIDKSVTIVGGKLSGNKVTVVADDVTFENCEISSDKGQFEVSTSAGDVTFVGCTFTGAQNPYINQTTGKVTIKNCVFNPHSCCAEIVGNESNFEVKGNIFYKSFTFTHTVASADLMTDATKNFCNEVLKNNTFKKANKIAVSYSPTEWFYINEPIAE